MPGIKPVNHSLLGLHHICWEREGETDRHTDKYMHRLRQTDIQVDRHTEKCNKTHTRRHCSHLRVFNMRGSSPPHPVRKRSGLGVECLTETEGTLVRASPVSLRCGHWARHIYPSLVLVQRRKTRPCLTERLLMGRKESNQTKKNIPCKITTLYGDPEPLKFTRLPSEHTMLRHQMAVRLRVDDGPLIALSPHLL